MNQAIMKTSRNRPRKCDERQVKRQEGNPDGENRSRGKYLTTAVR